MDYILAAFACDQPFHDSGCDFTGRVCIYCTVGQIFRISGQVAKFEAMLLLFMPIIAHKPETCWD